ncbi:MFS transporter, partial [Micrococcus luteus]
LGLTATQFGWGAGIMFAGYCVFEVPSNLALYRFGARRWLARIMITWGLMAAATALATGPTSFYAIRLLLGIGEAGFFPGVIFFLAVWFPASYRTRVLAWFTVSTPLSSLIGGPLSTWLLQLDGATIKAGTQLATWDPLTRPIITEYGGTVKFENVEEGVTVAKQIDDVTGLSTLVVIDVKRRGSQASKSVRPQ